MPSKRPAIPLTLSLKHSTMLVLYSIIRDHQVSMASAITALVVLGASLPPEKPIPRYHIRKVDPADPFCPTSVRTTDPIWAAGLLMVPNQFSSMSAFIEWCSDERAQYVFDYYADAETSEKLRTDLVERAHRVTLGYEPLPAAAPFLTFAPKVKHVRQRLVAGACPRHTGPECPTCKGQGTVSLTLKDWAKAYGVSAKPSAERAVRRG